MIFSQNVCFKLLYYFYLTVRSNSTCILYNLPRVPYLSFSISANVNLLHVKIQYNIYVNRCYLLKPYLLILVVICLSVLYLNDSLFGCIFLYFLAIHLLKVGFFSGSPSVALWGDTVLWTVVEDFPKSSESTRCLKHGALRTGFP